ncbi:replication-relaxation family protein [Streptomyces sp. AC550_RSS872]|uniref:replication-relaxation family protein n=1 Tax=Streptomyces sp. AC550_RSS872 TaxID=2823689 RepID=UPI001C252834|nr:replication-relaxation family protein [Streptomyces sp. AC550_RSS872]
MGGSRLRRYGSTGRTRTMCLAALGVVKVATPDQIRRLMCPGTKDAATVRGGLKDLETEKLVISPGSAVRVNDDGVRVTEKLWTLTPAGLEAAAVVLDRPAREMGGTAKAAAASGAKHARAVTDVLDAFLQTPPEPTQPVVRKHQLAPAAPPAALVERPEGLGPLTAWSTEAVLPVGGTFLSPARGSLRADMVFASPGHDVTPLLFVEVDNGTEGPPIVADKIERYRRFFARRVSLAGREVPLWRTVWPASPRDGYPPVALVFTKNVGQLAMQTRMREVGELAREHWRGEWNGDGYAPEGQKPDGYRDYDRTVPLLATTLRLLAAHGPHGPVWWRYGHASWQPLVEALDNPDDYRAYSVRAEARRKAQEAELERARREQEAERRRLEAGKWVCPTCQRFVYPADGLTPGGECGPCHADRRRAAEAAQEQTEQPPTGGGIFGRRRRT